MLEEQSQQSESSELAWHMAASPEEIANILVEFAEELRRGEVVIWKEKRELHIDPTGKVEMSVHAGNKDGHEGLHIDMKWIRRTS